MARIHSFYNVTNTERLLDRKDLPKFQTDWEQMSFTRPSDIPFYRNICSINLLHVFSGIIISVAALCRTLIQLLSTHPAKICEISAYN